MPIIEYPKQNVLYFAINDIFVKGDDASVLQYCTEQGLSLVSYEVEQPRFSNDGGLAYQYYANGAWTTEFGYAQIVTSITYS